MSDNTASSFFATEGGHGFVRIGFAHRVVCDLYSLNLSTSKLSPPLLPITVGRILHCRVEDLDEAHQVLLHVPVQPFSDRVLLLPRKWLLPNSHLC